MKRFFWFMVGIGLSQLLWLTVAQAASIGLHGGYTSPHSDCDGGSCLDPGYAVGVSVESTWKFNEHFGIRYGVTGWRMNFSKADRDNVDAPKTNEKGQEDYILHSTFKPSVTLWGISLYPNAGLGLDTSGELYTVLGGGVDVPVYDNWHIELQYNEIRSNCTWHRTTTIGVRYAW